MNAAGYWVVWSRRFDSATHVEHVETFERARELWRWHLITQSFVIEVYAADDLQVLLHRGNDTWQMSEPREPGRYRWNEGSESFARLGDLVARPLAWRE